MNIIEFGDCRDTMRAWAAQGVRAQMCVTSPPYFGLRDYGHAGQLGLEQTPDQYIAAMVEVFRCVRDVLADDGTLWLNIGDSYASKPNGPAGIPKADSVAPHVASRTAHARRSSQVPPGLKHKDLIGIPWMLAFALRADGWYLRQDIIWHKPNPMPESVGDRCTKAHEYLFLLSKGPRYFFDSGAMQEPAAGVNNYPPMGGPVPGAPPQGRLRPSVKRGGFAGKTNAMPGREAFRATSPTRNRRSVWTVATRPYKGAHFATFPPALIEPCIRAGSRAGDIVLDPFMGSGTTAAVALQHGRQYLGCELNPDYEPLQRERIEASAAPPTARPRRRAARPPEPEPAQRGLF
ncbi:DNA methylase family protein [Delftia acidovorans]|uniref:DNA-methyltransferase n=1 Tax=Delftia acidovorans TaxID=80866 RepID=UPI000503310A|nr:site-specific DNA-methyltransferase [Delftia acidovorans]KFJ08658.1 DNA methylase family protein [Delftia acidovorans]QQB48434.1 site-specific DNA-methyltransferase [Delftia acidovorans]